MVCAYLLWHEDPAQRTLFAVDGILMGLIIITPLAGFVSPASSMILGLCGGPLFLCAEHFTARSKWFANPAGLFPGHLAGGLFGVLMIAFFAQKPFAAGSGLPKLPNGILFGGGSFAWHQLSVELLGIGVVMATVFVLSFATVAVLARLLGGITTDYDHESIGAVASTLPSASPAPLGTA